MVEKSFQKEVKFNLGKLKRKLTTKTYQILITEIEKLFLKFAVYLKIKRLLPTTKGSFHRKKDLPKILKYWSQNIYDTKSFICKIRLEINNLSDK